MKPEYAFIMPTDDLQNQMRWFQEITAGMRDDQVRRVWHLAHSWGAKSGMDYRPLFRLLRRAIKNTLNNLP